MNNLYRLMFKIKQNNVLAFLLLSAFVVIVNFNLVKNPNTFLVTGGDGIKNYYTHIYHIKHDSSYLTFEGMNYPFGEHIVFTDNQPIFSIIIKFITTYIPSLNCHLIYLHNLALVFGWFIGAIGLFLSLRRLEVSWYWALVCTMGLMLLQPQSDRMNGHFALAYPIISWYFYAWIRYWQGSEIFKMSLFIGFLTTFMGLIHMYYFVIGAILASIVLFVEWTHDRKKITIKDTAVGFILQVILPYIIIHYFTSLSHNFTDRPTEPWGFFAYRSYWEGLLFSYKLPLYDFINNNIVEVRQINSEGKAYIGLFSVVLVLYCIFLIFRFFIKKNWSKINPINSKMWQIFILTALVAFGVPFIIPGMENLLDYTGPFKQFRSIGRVAWLSFYAINLISIPWVFSQLSHVENLTKRQWLYIVLPLVLLSEGIIYNSKKQDYSGSSESFSCSSKIKNLPVSFDQYQAILPNPFYHNGSEGFLWDGQANNVLQSFELSYNSGLPIMATMMSRTPLYQSLLLCDLVNAPIKVPEVIQLIKSKDTRPLLVIESKHPIENDRSKIDHWTRTSPIVFENDEYILRRLELNTFDTIVAQYSVPDKIKVGQFQFEKKESRGLWGYEAEVIDLDSLKGRVYLEYDIEVTDATKIMSTTEIFQFDANSNLIDFAIEGNRWNYNNIVNNDVTVTCSVHIKDEATKMIIRYKKFNHRKRHDINLKNGVVLRN